MNEKYMNICQTCLSCDRLLFSMGTFEDLLSYFNITIYKDYKKCKICWECKSIILKFYKFKIQVSKAQEILSKHKLENISKLSSLKIQTIKVNANFNYEENEIELETIKKEYDETISTNETVDNNDNINDLDVKHENHHLNDRGIENNENIQDDIIFVNETNEKNDEVNDFDEKNKSYLTKENNIERSKYIYDDITTINETIKNNDDVNDLDVKNKINNTKEKTTENNEMINDKIKTIILTEEEMMKNRDLKRNQPNFKKIPFKCDSCVLGFNLKDNFDLHNEKKHHESLGKHKCPVCLTRFETLKAMSRHKLRHYTVYKCVLCDYDSVSSMAAFKHCFNKHKQDNYGLIHCGQCDVVVSSAEELKEHIKIQHVLRCEECGETFKGRKTLRTHKLRIHSSKRNFSCEICSKTFNTQSRLESHITSHNTSIAQNLCYCAICDVQYKNIYIYRNHLKNSKNHSERLYHCKECNKKFASKVYWKKHYDFYHLKKSPFKCDTCNKLFMSDWRLKNHKQKHHGLKRTRDHNCNVCGKSFFTQRTLRGHKLTHSDERTYMCSECGDTFKQQPALYTHCKLVHRNGKINK